MHLWRACYRFPAGKLLTRRVADVTGSLKQVFTRKLQRLPSGCATSLSSPIVMARKQRRAASRGRASGRSEDDTAPRRGGAVRASMVHV
jgi:hypothetical protein